MPVGWRPLWKALHLVKIDSQPLSAFSTGWFSFLCSFLKPTLNSYLKSFYCLLEWLLLFFLILIKGPPPPKKARQTGKYRVWGTRSGREEQLNLWVAVLLFSLRPLVSVLNHFRWKCSDSVGDNLDYLCEQTFILWKDNLWCNQFTRTEQRKDVSGNTSFQSNAI